MTSVADFIVPRRGSADPSTLDPETRCVLLEHIEARTGLVSSVALYDLELRSSKKTFEAGDILFGKLRPALRKVAVAEFDGICSSDIAVFRPTTCHVHLLAAVLRGDSVGGEIESNVSGASLPRVAIKDILATKVGWPDDSEVERLDAMARYVLEMRRVAHRALSRCADVERALTVG